VCKIISFTKFSIKQQVKAISAGKMIHTKQGNLPFIDIAG